MSIGINVRWDRSQLKALEDGPFKGALRRALRKAGATALRDMRSEASKRIRARKRIKPSYIARALTLRRPGGNDINAHDVGSARLRRGGPADRLSGAADQEGRDRRGQPRQAHAGRGAFIATMKSGHKGVFRRVGKARLPIHELLGSRPVDALLHEGEAQGVADRGGASFAATFVRVLPLELGK